MFLLENIVSGEKFQNLADMYLGFEEDFKYNPKIWEQKEKHCPFDKIPRLFDNPKIIFCYSHRLQNLIDKIGNFNNKFVYIIIIKIYKLLLLHRIGYNFCIKKIFYSLNFWIFFYF